MSKKPTLPGRSGARIYSMDHPAVLILLVLAGLSLAGKAGWTAFSGASFGTAFLLWTGGLFFLFAIRPIYQSRHLRIRVTDSGLERRDGRSAPLSLEWKEMGMIRDEFFRGRWILHEKGGKRKIAIPYAVRGFDEVRERILDEMTRRSDPPSRPEVFEGFLGKRLVLSAEGFQLESLSGVRRMKKTEIARAVPGYHYFLTRSVRCPFLEVVPKTGKPVRLYGWCGKLPEIERVLRRLLLGKSFILSRSPLSPVFLQESRLSETLWKSAAVGAFSMTSLGLFIGKFIPLSGGSASFELGFCLLGFLLIALLLWAFHRKTLVLSQASPRIEPEPILSAFLAVSALVLGFGAAAYGWGAAGRMWLEQTRSAVAKSGYADGPLRPLPRLSNPRNAAPLLVRAEELPSSRGFQADQPGSPVYFYGKKTQMEVLSGLMEDMGKGKWPPLDRELALNLLAAHQDGISLIAMAFHKKGVDWSGEAAPSAAGGNPAPVDELSDWSMLFLCKAQLLAGQGRGPAALESLKTALFLGEAARQWPFFSGEALGEGIDQAALSRAPFILARVEPGLVEKEFFPFLPSGEYPERIRRFLQKEFFDPKSWNEETALGWIYEPFVDWDRSSYERACLVLAAALDKPYSLQRESWKRAERDFGKNTWFLGSMRTPPPFSLWNGALEVQACASMVRASVEARVFRIRNNRWPEKASDLRPEGGGWDDPFADGQDLKIAAGGKGLLISSLGPEEEGLWGKGQERRPLVCEVGK
jgi:hypothetical protein